MGQENFPCNAGQGKDRVRQNHVGRGSRPYLSNSLRPIAIPTLYLFRSSFTLTSLLFFSHKSLFPTCPNLLSLTHSFIYLFLLSNNDNGAWVWWFGLVVDCGDGGCWLLMMGSGLLWVFWWWWIRIYGGFVVCLSFFFFGYCG